MALSECNGLMGDVLPPRGKVRDYEGRKGRGPSCLGGSGLCALETAPNTPILLSSYSVTL